jgi:osmotically-inducible protein OsmY
MLTATKLDADIQQDVLAEFEWDPQVEPTEIGVQVDDGIVTLTGTVDTYVKKMAAERCAQKIMGVRAVANDLSVRTRATHNDTDIAHAVANALEANSLLPLGAIDATVQNGKVTLKGQVNWEYQRRSAHDSVQYLSGVRDVNNLITLKQPKVSAVEVRSGIEQALVRAAELDAAGIQVSSDDGHVTLRGTVRAWPEKRAADGAAWKSPGVTRVTNEISVLPY